MAPAPDHSMQTDLMGTKTSWYLRVLLLRGLVSQGPQHSEQDSPDSEAPHCPQLNPDTCMVTGTHLTWASLPTTASKKNLTSMI
ncbi:hypothetical protein Cadr_000010484 [Camelus dromedarius]|uniref:Uncharacterized protein n=1 Tax=Camelus dromedarius TaxID=9838 RepID=A0A5N4DX58_CAMDR|nr:hypothetical protein Cadr_000010484 [Camelus dromedarius]